MRFRLMALIPALLLMATQASANSGFPTLFNVTGIEADNVLDIRSGPSDLGDPIGYLPSDGRDIEVSYLSVSGKWGRVNSNERSGWVSMRYLTEKTETWPEDGLPEEMSCFGTEPFWWLRFSGETAEFETPEESEPDLSITSIATLGDRTGRARGVIAQSDRLITTTTMSPCICSDGMSERTFGLRGMVIRQDNDSSTLLSGCCSIGR